MDFGRLWHEFIKGVFKENALLMSLIGLCSALAVSARMENGIYLGIAATFVLVFSELIISIFKNLISREVRIPVYIVVIASFVTLVDLLLQAFNPEMYKILGIWVPLIVVNCMILGRIEVFAAKESPLLSVLDALGIGLGYTIVLVLMGFIREILGTGKLEAFGKTLLSMPTNYEPARIFIMFPGAFLTFAFLIVVLNWYLERGEKE